MCRDISDVYVPGFFFPVYVKRQAVEMRTRVGAWYWMIMCDCVQYMSIMCMCHR
jgi:hypothetical protein